MNSKILVTGFQPFLNEAVNPSGLLLEVLGPKLPRIETLLLPVSYKKSVEVLRRQWESRGPYRALVMLGQAAGRKAISLERVAVNWSETSYADEDGVKLNHGPLVTGAPPAYISEFFPNSWAEELNREGATQVSFSAGTYVCNAIYFSAMHSICARGTKAIFVHVPYLPEQTVTKPEQPSMALEVQAKVILRLIELIDASRV